MEPRSHWDRIYSSRAAVIDVGGGASTLVNDLLASGMTRVTVLDISQSALQVAQRRLGQQAQRVTWIAADITKAQLGEAAYDVWHDRAVFHFLTDPADRAAYVAQVRRAVRPGGHVIVAAFAPDGPEQCSGLPVVRYGPGELHSQFGGHFELLEHASEDHHTPAGIVQHFVYCHCMVH